MTAQRCGYCGSDKHTVALCPRTAAGQAARQQLRCDYCGSKDHGLKACPHTYAGSVAHARHTDHFKKD